LGTATDSRDENLKAKVPGGGGRVKVEAEAARAHDLDATDAAIQSNWTSSRCHPSPAEWLANFPASDWKSEIRQSLIDECITLPAHAGLFGFGLRSASHRRKPAAPAAHCECSLVTSARFEKRNGRGREGKGATESLCSEANRALVTAGRVLFDAFASSGVLEISLGRAVALFRTCHKTGQFL